MSTSTQVAATPNLKQRFAIRLPNCAAGKFIFKNGKTAAFVGGEFLTNVPSEIAELEEEIAAGHPHIFRDPDNMVVDSTTQDPMASIKAKIIREYEAEQAARHRKDSDKGTSGLPAELASRVAGIATSASISSVSADSSSGTAGAAGK